MTVEHLKKEIIFLEDLQEKGIMNNTSEVKLFWFRDALMFVEKPEDCSNET